MTWLSAGSVIALEQKLLFGEIMKQHWILLLLAHRLKLHWVHFHATP